MRDGPCVEAGRTARLWTSLALTALAAAPRLTGLNRVLFGGDEAQDSAMIRRMVEARELLQAGMLNSLGTVNLPLFDYLMLPPFVLSPDPRVATAYVAALNVVAVLLTYAFARRVLGAVAGTIAGALFAVAPWPVLFSRKIWPPYLIVPFAALCLYAFFRSTVGTKRSPWWAAGALASWLWISQLHPVALLEAPAFALAGPRFWRQLRPIPVASGVLIGVAPAIPFLALDSSRGWSSLRTYLSAARAQPTISADSIHWSVLNVTGLDTLQYAGIVFAKFTPYVDLFAALERATTALFVAATLLACGACAWGSAPWRSRARRSPAGPLLVLLGWAWLPALLTLRHGAPVYQHYYVVQLPADFAIAGYAASAAIGWRAARTRRRTGPADPSEPGAPRFSWFAGSMRASAVVAALVAVVAGWATLLISFSGYLASGKGDAEYGLPLDQTVAMGALAARAGARGSLFAQADDLVAPMLDYATRDIPTRLRLPPDGLVIPPSGPAGYFFGDESLAPPQALERAGASPLGRVSYLSGARTAVALTSGSPPPTPAQLGADRPLEVRLVNGVVIVAAGVRRPSSDVLRVEYVWRVAREGAGVGDSDLAIYVHVVGSAGRTAAQQDGMPIPSSRWRAGDTIVAWLDVSLRGVPAGSYDLRGGMYERPSVRRVQAAEAGGGAGDGEFSLGVLVLP